MTEHGISSLSDRRSELDTKFLRRVEFGDYNISLNDYIAYNPTYNTRHKTIDVHHRLNCSKYSYYNRMRDQVKVIFPPTPNNPPTNN